jgi:uncharacterized protein (TIGR02001 family)
VQNPAFGANADPKILLAQEMHGSRARVVCGLSNPGEIMKKSFLAALAVTLAGVAPAVVQAQAAPAAAPASPHTFTGNLTIASEYRYRGIAQTNSKPAVQGGFDYAHSSGFYLGNWNSNVSWLSDGGAGTVSNSIEMDFYGGYKMAFGDITLDVGGLYYYYPGTYPSGFTSPNTFEIYAGLSWKFLSLKYSHSLTNLFGFVDSKGSGYLDLTGTFEIGNGFNFVAHVGHQSIPSGSVGGVQVRASGDCSYTDYKLGVTKEAMGLTWAASYIDTDAKGNAGQCYRNLFNKDLGRGTVVVQVTKNF